MTNYTCKKVKMRKKNMLDRNMTTIKHLRHLLGGIQMDMEVLVEHMYTCPQVAMNIDEGDIGGASPLHVEVTNLA